MNKRNDFISPVFFLLLSVFIIFSTLANADFNLIKRLDLDLDGEISIKEAVAEPRLLAVFGKIDLDGNGKITPRELSQSDIKFDGV